MQEIPNRLIVEINLDALAENFRFLQKIAGNRPVLPVVKANAYGCGAVAVTERLIREGARDFFVATLTEAISLRKAFSQIGIYVFEGVSRETALIFQQFSLRPVLNSLQDITEYGAFCEANANPAPAAIHFDTGMNRLGLSARDTEILLADPAKLRAVKPALILTHAACADTPDHPLNAIQKQKFSKIKAAFSEIPASYAASAAILSDPETHFDAIRPGIALYGGIQHSDLQTVVTVRAGIIQIREAEANESVGYGATCSLHRASRLAIIACGYADGFPRGLSGKNFHGFLNGAAIPLIGRVSMDTLIFDVTDIPVRLTDEIELIGKNASVFKMAEQAGTIPYEILTSLSRRAKYY